MSGHVEERQGTARYLQALAQHWPFVLGSIALAVTAAVAFLATAESRYEAHADVLVTPISADDETFVGIPVIRESGEGRGVLTAARLVETPQVADAVRSRLRLQTTRETLLDSVHVAPQEQSNIVTITAEGDSPSRAVAIANAFAEAMIAERTRVFRGELGQVVRRLTDRLEELPASVRDVGEARALGERLGVLRGLVGARDPTLQIVSRAVAPADASWPRPVLSLAVAFFAGLLLGVGIAIALELVNPLVLRDEDVLEQGLPLLARVPRTTPREVRAQLNGEALPRDVKDAYRLARVNLAAALENEAAPGTILVTSAARGEGKTTVAANLALVYAQAGLNVLLVDADLRRGRLTRVFGVEAQNGLRELLLDEATTEDALTPVRGLGTDLLLVGAGPDDGQAVDRLQSRRVAALVEELAAHADVVIFDSPPLTEVADALRLATTVDAVVLVVRFGRTRRDKLADARLLLAQLGVSPAGIVAMTRRRARGRLERRPAERRAARQPAVVREESLPRAGSSSDSR